MITTILHHAGDANDPPVRVAHTLALAAQYPDAYIVLGLGCAEAIELVLALSSRVVVFVGATDTLTEITKTLPFVLERGTDRLLISTEPGHVGRAARIARIIYRQHGVEVVASPSAPGTYRSPLRRTAIDTMRAYLFALTGKVVML